MKKVFLFSVLLILGLICSQFMGFFHTESRKWIELVVKNLALILLGFIMIQVGLEFSIDRTNLKQYGWDYFVAFTAATLPWIFCTFYFVYFLPHKTHVSQFNIWIDTLLLARFAAPTSAGVLFTMMAAARLEETWIFKKARILAIFDDLDTIILLIPIKMLLVGFNWEAVALLASIIFLIYLAWKMMRSLNWPINWYWMLLYSLVIAAICEGIYLVTTYLEDVSPLQLEILLPAFVLGCILAVPKQTKNIHKFFEIKSEKAIKTSVGALFLFLVGLSMPLIEIAQNSLVPSVEKPNFWHYQIGMLSIGSIFWHVIVITFLSNLGKMFPLFCYKKEVRLKERLALSLGMCPRGEVGAGIIILALGVVKHIDYSLIVVALLSLALNLILTGPIIMIIKKMIAPSRLSYSK